MGGARSPASGQASHRGYIPHVTIVAAGGGVLYDKSGEVDRERLAGILDRALAVISGRE